MTGALVFRSASDLARVIREGEATASEVLEAHLEQIGRHNSKLNAIVTLDEKAARQRAHEADAALHRGELWGPLHGVPFTVKDAYETRGLRTTSSYEPLRDHVPSQDATVVGRLLNAGGVLLGKTNMPMLALDYQSNSPVFGRANNPWDLERTPGGSTGGGAAALAAGLTPLEMGSDFGGSLRVPAHFCGVMAFKPTEHRVSTGGHVPEIPGTPIGVRHMACAGPLARSVGDLRLAFSLVAGPDPREPWLPAVPIEPPAQKDLAARRFAWTGGFGGLPVTQETQTALRKFASDLADRGCTVDEQNPSEFDFATAWQTWGEIAALEFGATLPRRLRLLLRMAYATMRGAAPIKRGLLRGAGMDMRRYVRAMDRRDRLIGALDRFLGDWDAWLCPVSTGPAFTHRRSGKRIGVDGRPLHYLMAASGYTCIFNLTGNPVVVLPLSRSHEGLPIGVQVVGRRWQDMELLAVAEEVSEVAPAFERPSGY